MNTFVRHSSTCVAISIVSPYDTDFTKRVWISSSGAPTEPGNSVIARQGGRPQLRK